MTAQSPSPDPKTLAFKALLAIFALFTTLGAIVLEYKDDIKQAQEATDAQARETLLWDVLSPTDEFNAVLADTSCDYVVLCGANPSPQGGRLTMDDVRAWAIHPPNPAGTPSYGPISLAVAAVAMVPKLPYVIYRMLANRWDKGSIAFLTGVLFVLIYIAILVVAARTNLLALIAMIPIGPFLVGGVFWVLTGLLAVFGYVVGFTLGLLLLLAAVPLLAFAILMRDLMEVRAGLAELGHLARSAMGMRR